MKDEFTITLSAKELRNLKYLIANCRIISTDVHVQEGLSKSLILAMAGIYKELKVVDHLLRKLMD